MLFDEIEKAHPDVFNILLQILDDGRLTDSQGRTVSFKNTIIILTSNIGSALILEAKELNDEVKRQIENILHKTFRPEFLNRIDAIVYFKKLSEKDVRSIAHIQIKHLEKRLAERNVKLHISDDALKHIAEIGYSAEFGARPLKRAVQNYITVPISQFLLKNPMATEVNVAFKNGELEIK